MLSCTYVVFYLRGYSIYINYFLVTVCISSGYASGIFVAKLLPFANAFDISNEDDKCISN